MTSPAGFGSSSGSAARHSATPGRIVVPLTGDAATREALAAATSLTQGRSSAVVLAAVHVIPFPADFECPECVQRHLQSKLAEIADGRAKDVDAVVVLARSEEEGFSELAAPGTTVLLSAHGHWPFSRERELARRLRRAGFTVAVLEQGSAR